MTTPTPRVKRVPLSGPLISALLALPEAELRHALFLLRLPLYPASRAPLAVRLSGMQLDALMNMPETELRSHLEMLVRSLGDPPALSTSDFCSGCRLDSPPQLVINDDFNPFLQSLEDDRVVQADDDKS